MFGNVLPISHNAVTANTHRTPIIEVIPISAPEICVCSYCGRTKRVAYHMIADNGKEVTACYPCADQGMIWLEQNFPYLTGPL